MKFERIALVFVFLAVLGSSSAAQITNDVSEVVKQREIAYWETFKACDLTELRGFFHPAYRSMVPDLRAEAMGEPSDNSVAQIIDNAKKTILMIVPGSFGYELDRYSASPTELGARTMYRISWWAQLPDERQISGAHFVYRTWRGDSGLWVIETSLGDQLSWDVMSDERMPAN